MGPIVKEPRLIPIANVRPPNASPNNSPSLLGNKNSNNGGRSFNKSVKKNKNKQGEFLFK